MSASMIPSLYGVVGFPLGHTLSPLLHNTAFRELGIPAVYVPWSVEPDKLRTFVEAVRLLNIRGVSVTIPHKKGIVPLVDQLTDRVKELGAANLIYWDRDALWADNTDILGFMSPLETLPPSMNFSKVLLLGSGGAARAAAVGLKKLGLTDITVTDIVDDLPAALAEAFDLKLVSWSDRSRVPANIVVNATPLGMKGEHEEETAYPVEAFQGRRGIAYDIVYTPFVTRFQREAAAAGWRAISGRDMFISQANYQFHTWTGQSLPEKAKLAVFDALNSK